MKKLFLIFLSLIIPAIIYSENSLIDSLLLELDKAIEENSEYMEAKEQRIFSLKSIKDEGGNDVQIYDLNNRIFEEYRYYNLDSALFYLDKNLDLSEKIGYINLINETKLNLSKTFILTGSYKEARDILVTIDKRTLSENQKSNYYLNYFLLYDELSGYTSFEKIGNKYRNLSNLYLDTLLLPVDKELHKYWILKARIYLDEEELIKNKKIVLELLNEAKQNTSDYSYYAYLMSVISDTEYDFVNKKKYLILSAMSDIKSAIKDNASLSTLAQELYKEKDINRAYKYIRFALDDASFFNARLRLTQVSNMLPVINTAYQQESENQKQTLRYYVIIISVLSLSLLVAVVLIYKQVKSLANARNELQDANTQLNELNSSLQELNGKLQDVNNDLSDSNKIKEQYIGTFLEICSTYIDKLDNYRKKVNKMLVARKISELNDLTKSKQLFEDEVEEFYQNFDNTFLNIFPNFVADLNALLLDDEKIILKEGIALNTELRIFALIRLGINDSSQIASLLRYSVNTIYNYRVKIKNKAISRDDFENKIMKIGAFAK